MKKSILLLDVNTAFCTKVIFYHLREMKNIRALESGLSSVQSAQL